MENTSQPYQQNRLLRLSYSLIAPLYDFVIQAPMRRARKHSLCALPLDEHKRILISGAGTGLDFPVLPTLHHYIALDFNAAMLMRAVPRADHL